MNAFPYDSPAAPPGVHIRRRIGGEGVGLLVRGIEGSVGEGGRGYVRIRVRECVWVGDSPSYRRHQTPATMPPRNATRRTAPCRYGA